MHRVPSFPRFPLSSWLLPVRSSSIHLPVHRGECVRLKQFVTNSEIVGNDVSYCGVHDYRYNGGDKNGEAIYIGTSSNQVRVRRSLSLIKKGCMVHLYLGTVFFSSLGRAEVR